MANRELAAFFFDGVPDSYQQQENNKNKAKTISVIRNSKSNNSKEELKYIKSIHKPFKEKKCNKCHDRTSDDFLVVSKEQLCFQCHEKKKFFNRFVHGPVAPGRCMACHYPHKSSNPFLLKFMDEKLCYQCHDSQDIKKIKDHENRADCLKCHDPHTQDNKFFLKPEVNKKMKVVI